MFVTDECVPTSARKATQKRETTGIEQCIKTREQITQGDTTP